MRPSKIKICFVTSSRAEYGILKPVMRSVSEDPDFQLQLVVTGTHLRAKYGMTVNEIKEDGFKADKLIPLRYDRDSRLSTVTIMASCQKKTATAFTDLKPDWVFVLGDRFEILAAAQAAFIMGIPIAHLAGGDVTEGAMDDAFRHSITKMASVHLATHERSRQRIMQLGEDPDHVHTVGNPALDNITSVDYVGRPELEGKLKIKFEKFNGLITFHPTTHELGSAIQQLNELLRAVRSQPRSSAWVFTAPNQDPMGQKYRRLIKAFVRKNKNTYYFNSLGQTLYWNVMHQVDVVVGNSSSGIYEAPSFGKPTINIGVRQKGRLAPDSVIHCDADFKMILSAIQKVRSGKVPAAPNPYGNGRSSHRILSVLRGMRSKKVQLVKPFWDYPVPTNHSPIQIIAEAGVNHNGSIELARRLVDAAVVAGADVIKFQSFTAEALASDIAPKAAYQWLTTDPQESHKAMLRRLELSDEMHFEIKEYCDQLGIEFMSSPFDVERAEFLARSVKVRRFKIPSGEITNGPYLFEVAKWGLPIILSTGMANMDEIETALKIIAFGYTHPSKRIVHWRTLEDSCLDQILGTRIRDRVTLLHCVSQYPAPIEQINLRAIETLRSRFGLKTGYSDHSAGIHGAIAAVSLGAEVIEKHLTLSRGLEGPDHKASLQPEEFKKMVRGIREVWQMLGNGDKVPMPCESEISPIARKSLFAKKSIKRGERFSADNLTAKRPGSGLSPMRFWEISNTVATRDYAENELIQ